MMAQLEIEVAVTKSELNASIRYEEMAQYMPTHEATATHVARTVKKRNDICSFEKKNSDT